MAVLVSRVALLLLVLVAHSASAFYFFVPDGQKLCFAHESNPDSSTISGHYSTAQAEGNLNILVTDPKRNKALDQDVTKFGTENAFHFTTSEPGRFDICFKYTGPTGQLKVSLDISETVNKDYRDPSVSLHDYASRAERLRSIVQECDDELQYFDSRQNEFDVTVSSTHNRVFFATIIEVFVVVGIVGWQVLHLRNFFRQKKLA